MNVASMTRLQKPETSILLVDSGFDGTRCNVGENQYCVWRNWRWPLHGPAKPCLHSWPTETETINVCCFKPLRFSALKMCTAKIHCMSSHPIDLATYLVLFPPREEHYTLTNETRHIMTSENDLYI